MPLTKFQIKLHDSYLNNRTEITHSPCVSQLCIDNGYAYALYINISSVIYNSIAMDGGPGL